jgi:hypothetical protein
MVLLLIETVTPSIVNVVAPIPLTAATLQVIVVLLADVPALIEGEEIETSEAASAATMELPECTVAAKTAAESTEAAKTLVVATPALNSERSSSNSNRRGLAVRRRSASVARSARRFLDAPRFSDCPF